MPKTLVVVESPAKVRTLSKFLGRRYMVKASVGHVRDLPKSQLGVDVENAYSPKYITIRGKGDVIRDLRDAAKKADRVLLATDPDREGEAISWHLAHILKLEPDERCRIEFNEITEGAVRSALEHPRPIDRKRVEAQQARRILDRLVGYNLSPFLWRKVRRGLSAGRVQSSALRLICDREREIEAFIQEEYWSLTAVLSAGKKAKFEAKLVEGVDLSLKTRADVDRVLAGIEGATYTVASVTSRDRVRNPAPPFTTSTLQQEAFRKLGFSARRTMAVAQQLYEGVEVRDEGHVALITYMRTDSTRVAKEAQAAAREFIEAKFGPGYVPEKPRTYGSKSRAQDAHEAIRPTVPGRTPDSLVGHLGRDQLRLYRLIWERFIASQMTPAIFEAVAVDISASKYTFRATGLSVKFPGFTALYTEGRDDDSKDREQTLPKLEVGQSLTLIQLVDQQHFTQPPPRYTEATLVKALEKNGIGRPSTYAPIIETIRKRDYAVLEEKRFRPTEVGFIVYDLLRTHFPSIVDLEFTARMEKDLDLIESGEENWVDVTDKFYGPFSKLLEAADAKVERVEIPDEPTDELCPKCHANLVIKTGRFGKFIACPRYPECKYTRSMVRQLSAACPVCGEPMVERRTKTGRRFYGCSAYPRCTFTVWNRPSDVVCVECGSLTISRKGKHGTIFKCANPKCGHSWRSDGAEANSGAR
ncbi:MAG: type I DNA topoisomerase [Firmicutes bacterium]|jgi:DNA topoisomerase-1|nr:type I DNA topoisomerase [Bacillota bacterium]